MKYYCVLWIPTVFHKKPLRKPDVTIIKNVNISDIDNIPHNISVDLDQDENIIIKSDSPDSHSILLKRIDYSNNGLFLYEYDIEDKKENRALIGDDFPFAIYHIVKEFYHTHEHHGEDEDTHLAAYTNKIRPDIKALNNEALIHYLRNYEKKFVAYLSQIQNAYAGLLSRKKESNKRYKLATDSHEAFSDFCCKVRGEELYYNSLNKSKYNTLCKSGLGNDSEEESQLSKIAFNIENALANIKYIEEKAHNEFGFDNAKISFNIAWLAFYIGAGLGLISIALGAIPFFK
ncbi:hypothetical protein CLV62_1352 [Dysgonomonas alginatilytica]|uniref:CorA-like Mg2+ transporter protein n=1 Tax=Dysgonomonas alginatilytica TaxID=1605892 RepID=A0A2V3PIJ6_9BACT|nr:hypothetical protein [Dysgonomonas alginatilytica]PXV59430.1 hypothetical protein CLV62_1352 [Dysgonomonas alginatilytica]